jgi:5-hydroxyisourate hydrolase
MTISLSTHVLDTGHGRPAAGLVVELRREGHVVAAATTDDEGRVAALADGLAPGGYELVFFPETPFFRRVVYEISLEEGHYHVPLLVSAYGCVSYRGS